MREDVLTCHSRGCPHAKFYGYTHKMKKICRSEGHICRREGSRQLQSVFMSLVAIAIAEAAIAPRKYEALKKDVKVARSLGCPSSPIRAEALTIHMTMPKPRTILAKMYIPTRRRSVLSLILKSGKRVLTILGKALKKGTNNHDQRSSHDRPTPSEKLAIPRKEWDANE